MSVRMLFNQLEVGQIFERTCPYDKETRRYMKVTEFCVGRFDSEGRFSGVDNKTCNSINLKDGKPASFIGWEYVVVSDTQEIPDLQKNKSVKFQSAAAFDDCDGGHDDGVCIRDIDTYHS